MEIYVTFTPLDNTIRLYNMHKKKAQRVYEGHEGPVLCMATDDKETQLYSGSQDGKIIKWDIARQEILKKIDAHLSAVLTITVSHTRRLISTLFLTFSSSRDYSESYVMSN